MTSATGPLAISTAVRRSPGADAARPVVLTSERFLKGHGTGNDFILLPDADDRIELTEAMARALCDRRRGIGADGVIRVGRSAPWTPYGGAEPAGLDGSRGRLWFMDHRNADGSAAQMCGNGARLFGRYLVDAGWAPAGRFPIGTRAGPRMLDVPEQGDVAVDLGAATCLPQTQRVRVAAGAGGSARGDGRLTAGGLPGFAVSMGNPHVVVEVADAQTLKALDLSHPPEVTPGLPDGQNVEFVLRTGVRAIRLRVHERGVGETASCGTGICAAVAAMAGADGTAPTQGWQVSVPGGRLMVRAGRGGALLLTGPAVLVAEGRVDLRSITSCDSRRSGQSNRSLG